MSSFAVFLRSIVLRLGDTIVFAVKPFGILTGVC